MEWPTRTPISVEKKLVYGSKTMPFIGSAMKIQLNHTPEISRNGPASESQTMLNAAKTATSETKDEFFHFLIESGGHLSSN